MQTCLFVFLVSPRHSYSFFRSILRYDIQHNIYTLTILNYFKLMTDICLQHVTHLRDLQASGAWWECMRCWTRFGQRTPSLAQHVAVVLGKCPHYSGTGCNHNDMTGLTCASSCPGTQAAGSRKIFVVLAVSRPHDSR